MLSELRAWAPGKSATIGLGVLVQRAIVIACGFGAATVAHAKSEPVSLLQEQKEIQCEPMEKSTRYDRLFVDKKDTLLHVFKGKDLVEDYERIRFLDTAMLLKSRKNPDLYALFHILPHGEISLIEGEFIAMTEGDCEDTGASKSCKSQAVERLVWSPEKLSLKKGKVSVDPAIDTYGFFANHGTFFRAKNKAKSAPSLTLVDYGAPFQLLVGPASELKCRYL